MTNTQYVEALVSSSERIYIDTATLMEEGMERFIFNNKELLMSSGRKMIVPTAVRSELARHLEGENAAKCKSAMRAIGLIAKHADLFEVENTPLTDEQIAGAFADIQLLSELTLHKGDCNQLLITNDRRLSRDAFYLNQQESCKGYHIRVCYINHLGYLNCCDCVKEYIKAQRAKSNSDRLPAEEVPRVSTVATDSSANEEWHFDIRSAGICAFFLGMIEFGVINRKSVLKVLTKER